MSAARPALLCALVLSSCSTAHQALRAGCFEQHLHDAIALNEGRRALYAERTGGASEAITDRLVASERALLPVAWAFDSLESSRPERDIVGLCDMLEPMSKAPAPTFGAAAAAGLTLDVGGLAERLSEDLAAPHFERVARTAEEALSALEGNRSTSCMLRHLLESILRAANVAALHEQQNRARGARPATRLHQAFLRAHIAGLEGAARLDDQAAPLQLRGVPIICSDVPPISPLPERYPRPAP